jgi:hypothetical protein
MVDADQHISDRSAERADPVPADRERLVAGR